MNSIEEAFAELGRACWWVSRAPDTDEGINFIANEQAAARALMLAVLDEVEGAALRSASAAINDEFVDDAITPLRARIAALGNGGEEA